jgi:protein-S-isoprenylcysteine O-methyltransferase Ste14
MNRPLFILVLSLLWMVSEIVLGIVKHSKDGATGNLDKKSLRVLWITIMASLVLGIFIEITGIGYMLIQNIAISSIGIIVLIAGLIIRWIAILTLRRYFTVDVNIRSDHKIVDYGLYRYLRHPSYAGSILSFLGLGLAFCNWLSILILVIPVSIAYLYRIHVEEAALIGAFGDAYREYSRRTKRLIPGIY